MRISMCPVRTFMPVCSACLYVIMSVLGCINAAQPHTLMTLPNAESDLLIFFASFNLSPVAPVFFTCTCIQTPWALAMCADADESISSCLHIYQYSLYISVNVNTNVCACALVCVHASATVSRCVSAIVHVCLRVRVRVYTSTHVWWWCPRTCT